ncbi:hypothetical protein UA08_04443 [Talaromyces atroroseus]|uniref:RNA polymerase II transcription factor SIII subunit A n=1 Tax=Talaromyces atroroseus TaxID=1441469 RepID=A0A1Q5Q9H2_TALAT|nr:hypothetical protein UA08_04443 [Talaromyces atroroseus]OKL60777.1 hypothetical protein UA08_04443 [Talaromyces atroroseus]
MPARSLLAMSTRVAVQNVRSLTDIGNIPYSLARPFLLKVESPKQLRELEKNSPHIMQDDRELWMEFIKRDIPRWEQYDLPEESDCWYDIYCDLVEQFQSELEEGALQLKQAVDKFYSDKASNAAVLVKDTNRLPKPRRRFHTGSRTTESKKTGLFSSKRNKVLAVPTHQLSTGASRINHVPQWLVDEHKQVPSSTALRKRPDSVASKSGPSSTTPPVTNARSSQATPTRDAATRPRIAQPTSQSATSLTKSQTTPSSRPLLPLKRPSAGSPQRTQTGHSDLKGEPPVRPSPTPAKSLVRKRPIISQPNVFIQQKKRRT